MAAGLQTSRSGVARGNRRHPPKPQAETHDRYRWLAVAAILVIAIAAYANSLTAPFVLDDQVSVVENQHIRQLWPPSIVLTAEQDSPLAGRPIVNLSLALNYAVGGSEPWGYHVTNTALHLFSALLLFGLVRRTLDLLIARGRASGPSVLVAAAGAAVWVVHPLNTEAVTYVTQRTELLMGLCTFLTLYCSLRAHQGRSSVWLALAVASCAVGMGCKESMVTCPVLVMLFDRAFVYDSYREAFRVRGRWYLALAATWSILLLLNWSGPRMHSAGFSAGVSPWTYLLNQCVLIARYLQLAFWPRDLVFIYGTPQPLTLGDVLPSVVLVTAFSVAAVVLWFRRPAIGFLPLWVLITLSPSSSIVPIVTEVGAERRMYLPLAALSVLVVVALRGLVERLKASLPARWRLSRTWAYVAWGIAAVPIAGLLAATVDRNREYASGLVLAETSLARWPTGAAHHATAVQLILRGRIDEAWSHLEAAVRDTPRAEYTFGLALMERQRWHEAVEHLQAFVRAEPALEQVVSARTLMGDAWLRQGRADRAEEELRLALQMSPSATTARLGLADALSQQGRVDEAIDLYRQALGPGVRSDQATRNLALLLFSRGDYAEAVTYAQRNVEARPSDAVGHLILGVALAEISRWDESIAALQKARELDPGNTDVQSELARVLQLRGASVPRGQ